jgi:hypothetical protein
MIFLEYVKNPDTRVRTRRSDTLSLYILRFEFLFCWLDFL